MKIVDIVIGLSMGGVLSCIHFGGLWLVLKRMPTSERPAFLFWTTTMARYGITLYGMYLALTMGGIVLVGACAGLYLARLMVVPRLADRLETNGGSSLLRAAKE
ncbi:ATP synthase subunit I [Halodesulfovibrio aestuarii]|uniref:ATP synthase subunit I n=1 Tax=Halodesulfovibrio aestuarii TaxID=126333 RepID=A0ABV4JPS1_9BACT